MKGDRVKPNRSGRHRTALAVGLLSTAFVGFGCWQLYASENPSDFPDGLDAVQAAPGSHHVVFENELVRVLEVTIPPAGHAEPMHHHRWPSFFLDWDTGGKSPHVIYHRPDGSVRDIPSHTVPRSKGHWVIHWMQPEPMHAIEVVDPGEPDSGPTELRIEIKVRR